MKFLLKTFLLSSLLFFLAASLPALEVMNVWRHSEIAGKNSVFCDIGIAPFFFEGFDFSEISVLPVEVRIEYFPPFPLPFSLGFFFKTPYPNLKSFGLRSAYHFDLLDDVTDFYVVYNFDLGYLRNDLLIEYNDAPAEKQLYDFRVGVRRFFGQWFGLAIETGFHFESLIVLLSIKIN
jgi:hypothetical protein